jgi:hypothetical protein
MHSENSGLLLEPSTRSELAESGNEMRAAPVRVRTIARLQFIPIQRSSEGRSLDRGTTVLAADAVESCALLAYTARGLA